MEVKKYTQTDLRRSSAINLGKVGENNHLNLVFDVRAWMADYPDAEVVIYFKPASPGAPYIIDPTIEDGYASWVVRDVDTAFVGSGNMELILRNTDDGTVIKSVTANTKVAASPSSVPPSDSETPAGDWWSNTQSVLGNVVRYDIDMNLTDEQKERFRKNIGAGTGTGGGTGGANIDDTTPSATTTYSSQKIEAELKSQKEANATQDKEIEALKQSGGVTDEQIQAAVDSYLSGIAISGISAEEKQVFLTLFKAAAYTSDVSGTIAQLEALWGGTVEPDEPVVPTTYSITNTLTNATSDNTTSVITEGGSYTATITADEGYTLTGANVSVTMGGVDITADAYADGVVTIASVTGDVVITVAAVEEAAEDLGWTSGVPYEIEWMDGKWLNNSTGVEEDNASMSITPYLPSEGVNRLSATGLYSAEVFCYDEEKNFLRKNQANINNDNKALPVPRDATFIRLRKRLSTTNAVVTPWQDPLLTENTSYDMDTYYGLKYGAGSFNSSGAFVEADAHSVSELALCYGATNIQFGEYARSFIAWYDSNKSYIGQTIRQHTSYSIRPEIPPTGAAYFRYMRADTFLNSWVMLSDEPIYTVTTNLTNATYSMTTAQTATTQMIGGMSYAMKVAAASGYTLDTVTITMGGEDITATAYNSSTGVITIAEATGDLVITASAVAA